MYQRTPQTNVVTYESSILSKQGEIETFPFRLSFDVLNHSNYITRQLEMLPGKSKSPLLLRSL